MNRRETIVAALFAAFVIAAPARAATAKFAPPEGTVLLFIGQDENAADAYLKVVGQAPAGFMGYSGIRDNEGLDSAFDGGGGVQFADEILSKRKDTAFQLGLYMTDVVDDVASGRLDSSIDRLGAWIRRTGRPIFLRVGYEFDNPDNHYEPEAYKRAFRHVVERLRKDGVDNVAFVWHSCACAPPERVMDWYPGDAYVDWVGVSLFAQFPKSVEKVAAAMAKTGKPLMVAEASAWKARNETLKLAWFRNAFRFVQKTGARAFCYIDWNWDEIPAFSGNGWGDARVDATPKVLDLWRREMSRDVYLKAGAATLQAIGFAGAKRR